MELDFLIPLAIMFIGSIGLLFKILLAHNLSILLIPFFLILIILNRLFTVGVNSNSKETINKLRACKKYHNEKHKERIDEIINSYRKISVFNMFFYLMFHKTQMVGAPLDYSSG